MAGSSGAGFAGGLDDGRCLQAQPKGAGRPPAEDVPASERMRSTAGLFRTRHRFSGSRSHASPRGGDVTPTAGKSSRFGLGHAPGVRVPMRKRLSWSHRAQQTGTPGPEPPGFGKHTGCSLLPTQPQPQSGQKRQILRFGRRKAAETGGWAGPGQGHSIPVPRGWDGGDPALLSGGWHGPMDHWAYPPFPCSCWLLTLPPPFPHHLGAFQTLLFCPQNPIHVPKPLLSPPNLYFCPKPLFFPLNLYFSPQNP